MTQQTIFLRTMYILLVSALFFGAIYSLYLDFYFETITISLLAYGPVGRLRAKAYASWKIQQAEQLESAKSILGLPEVYDDKDAANITLLFKNGSILAYIFECDFDRDFRAYFYTSLYISDVALQLDLESHVSKVIALRNKYVESGHIVKEGSKYVASAKYSEIKEQIGMEFKKSSAHLP